MISLEIFLNHLKRNPTDINEGTGATVQGVKLTFVNSLKIPLPKLETQKQIVAQLDQLQITFPLGIILVELFNTALLVILNSVFLILSVFISRTVAQGILPI
jgi:hypothetical protein